MEMLYFASDNTSGIHPEIFAAIDRANRGSVKAYGEDPYTESATAALRTTFGGRAEVYFTFGGTGANVIAIASMARSFEAVFCAECSHLWSDECAAPEKFFGGKLVPVPAVDGKINPAVVAATMGENRGVHHAAPKVISITQPTEWGTIYRPAEIQALADYAHTHGLLLHVDGARLANAAAALDSSLAAISSDVGVDVLSFGGTKNGLMGGEAVVFINPDLARHTDYLRKQATQLASKMRFIAVQFEALLHDELWRRNADHANAMAARLAAAVSDIDGVEMTCPVEINALFPRLAPSYIAPLQQQCVFYLWDADASIARWMTSFDTTAADVDTFATLIRKVAGRHG
ncbi:MAG: aminotransferase class V-fold PLP-dependent enzyme [Proteobacteria bacterium]|nr:MAG: aminotransferase class V-fold PLP-dependent enzyme [Pseudomonadota bacterium]